MVGPFKPGRFACCVVGDIGQSSAGFGLLTQLGWFIEHRTLQALFADTGQIVFENLL
jgi:hypothetical protein